MGLREEKKRKTQTRILGSAKRIFSEKGFLNTSMMEIAKDAEVGAGTIYNYFPSKGALLITILSNEIEHMQKNKLYKLTDTASGDLVEIIFGVMKQLTSFFNDYSKAFWREIFHVITEEIEDNIHLRHGLFGLDEELMEWFKKLIESHSERFLIPIHPEDAAYTIYATTITTTVLYIYDANMTYEEFLRQVKKHVEFLFAGKLK